MRLWLMKSEPSEFSVDDLAAAPGKTTVWFGVRNYQARNFMRDQMRVGDTAFFIIQTAQNPELQESPKCASSHIQMQPNVTARASITIPRPLLRTRAGLTWM
jgi:predicted RNA-binding protein with PUA-like domain